MYYGSGEDSLVASTLLEAFALALLRQRARDGWCQNVLTGLSCGGSVVAGIVLEFTSLCNSSSNNSGDERKRFICVSLGSGTRCVGYEPPKRLFEADLLLRDGHAEVMARRGFIAFLLDAAEYLAKDKTHQHPFVEQCSFVHVTRSETNNNNNNNHNDTFPWCCFRLRDGVKVHLVCTESPCGAMSIRHGGGRVLLQTPTGRSLFVNDSVRNNTVAESTEKSFLPLDTSTVGVVNTDNVIVCHGHTMAAHRSHPADGLILVARVKPGKGRQNLSMSCSDKLLRWHCLGIQGRRRTRLFPERMRFESIWLPQTLDGVDKMENSFSLKEAERALNDRRHYFFKEETSPNKGNDVSDDTSRVVFNDIQTVPHVHICGFTPSSLNSLLNRNNLSLTKEEKEDEEGNGDHGNSDEKSKREKVDCCWSRSAWVSFNLGRKDNDIIPLLGVKRCRNEKGDDYDYTRRGDESHHSFAWMDSNIAVFNTKAGLPRGITRQCMERTVQQLVKLQPFPFKKEKEEKNDSYTDVEMVAGRFPLSRVWMAQRQERILQYLAQQHQQQQQQEEEQKRIFLQKTPTLHAILSGRDVENGVDYSFVEPVKLLPVGKSEKDDVIVAGGSVHYWLQQSEKNNNNNSNSGNNNYNNNRGDVIIAGQSEGGMCPFPLLWVEKGISMSSCEQRGVNV